MGPYSVFMTGGSYLTVTVNSRGGSNSPARVRWKQVVEVLHPVGAIVDEGMLLTGASVRIPDHLPGVVYTRCIATSASKSAKVPHLHLRGGSLRLGCP
jgi:hypothetical protein